MYFKKIKHIYFVYPYHKAMSLSALCAIDSEELIQRHTTTSELVKSLQFRMITGIKVLALVFIPILALNYLAKFIPFNFGDDDKLGVLDIIFWIFIVWDMFKTFQSITNYYPNLISSEIKRRVYEFNI